MFLKKVFSRSLLSFHKKVFLFFFIFLTFTAPVKAGPGDCIPKDHMGNKMSESGLGNLIDVIIGLVSNQIFGKMKSNSLTEYNNFADRDWDSGMVKKIFTSINTDFRFQTLFYLCVVLLIAYLGVSFAMGYSKLSSTDMIAQLVKIGVIVFLTSPNGWTLYFELVVKNILEASRYLNRAIIASMYNVPIEKITTPFQPINMVIDIMLDGDTWSKIAAILFSQGFLFASILAVAILYSMAATGLALVQVSVLYIATIISSSLLISLGPIFAICLLFEKTKTYFDKWVTSLIGIFMQQYILFLWFFIFCVIIAAMLKGIFYFETCHGSVIALISQVPMPKFIIDIIDTLLGVIHKITFGLVPRVHLPKLIIDIKIDIFSAQVPTAPVFKLPANIFTVACVAVIANLGTRGIALIASLGDAISGASLGTANMVKGAMDALAKVQEKGTAMAKDAAVAAVTGKFVTAPMRLISQGRDKLKEVVDARLAAGKDGALTKGLKGLTYALKPLSIGGDALRSVVADDDKIYKMNAIKKNNELANDLMKREVSNLVGDGKMYKDVNQLTDADKAQIRAKVEQGLAEKGYSLVEGKPMTLAMAQESLRVDIVSRIPLAGAAAGMVKGVSKLPGNIAAIANSSDGTFKKVLKIGVQILATPIEAIAGEKKINETVRIENPNKKNAVKRLVKKVFRKGLMDNNNLGYGKKKKK